ncbi:MAG: GlsB/YeaQ/YmgE family stress response membrane protein [Candidatus Microgenomates bacterium]|jgi:uncharacterized membrane protein YeaQ/YmgE (transglycosylase-associated protein family)
MNILIWLVLGVLAGWIAGLLTKSKHGIVGDIFLGIIGAFVGGFILSFFGQSGVNGFNFYSLVVAVIGAVILIILGRLIYR